MLIRRPHYYDRFYCLAGDCPDTCCASWDIVIDQDSLDFYQTIPGEFGEKVRSAITVDGDGDHCFSVSGGQCPLLTEERLCSIQLAFGEERVCDVCRSHPRFQEIYGPFREDSLAASCPGVADLLIEAETPAYFPEIEDDQPDEVCDDVDEELLAVLLPTRQRALELIQDRSRPLGERLALLMDFADALQDELDVGQLEEMEALCASWMAELPEREPGRRETMQRLLALLLELEILEDDWRELVRSSAETLYERLSEAEYAAACEQFQVYMADRAYEYEHLAAYFLYRWWLKADFDDDVYGKAALTVLSCLAVRELGMALWLVRGKEFSKADQSWLIHQWCKEQEHCAENIAALTQAVWTDPELCMAGL